MTGQTGELTVFGRFHARAGHEDALAEAVREVVAASRKEPGCHAIAAYRSTRDPQLLFVHSRWVDEAAFDLHADLPHTVRFLERARSLIDHELDVTRARALPA